MVNTPLHTLSLLDHPGALIGQLLKSPHSAVIFYDLPENAGCGEATFGPYEGGTQVVT